VQSLNSREPDGVLAGLTDALDELLPVKKGKRNRIDSPSVELREALCAIDVVCSSPAVNIDSETPLLKSTLSVLETFISSADTISTDVEPWVVPMPVILPMLPPKAAVSTVDLAIRAVAACFGAGDYAARKSVLVALFDLLANGHTSPNRRSTTGPGLTSPTLSLAIVKTIHLCLRAARRSGRAIKRPELATTLLQQLEKIFLVSEAAEVRLFAAAAAAEIPSVMKATDIDVIGGLLRANSPIPLDAQLALAAFYVALPVVGKTEGAVEIAAARLRGVTDCITSPVVTRAVLAGKSYGPSPYRAVSWSSATVSVALAASAPELLMPSAPLAPQLALHALAPAGTATNPASPKQPNELDPAANIAHRALTLHFAAHAALRSGLLGYSGGVSIDFGAECATVAQLSAPSPSPALFSPEPTIASAAVIADRGTEINARNVADLLSFSGAVPSSHRAHATQLVKRLSKHTDVVLNPKVIMSVLQGRPVQLSTAEVGPDDMDEEMHGNGKNNNAEDEGGDNQAATGLSAAVARAAGKTAGVVSMDNYVKAVLLQCIAACIGQRGGHAAMTDALPLAKAVVGSANALSEDTGLQEHVAVALTALLRQYGTLVAVAGPAAPPVPLLDELRVHMATAVRACVTDPGVPIPTATALLSAFAASNIADDVAMQRSVKALAERWIKFEFVLVSASATSLAQRTIEAREIIRVLASLCSSGGGAPKWPKTVAVIAATLDSDAMVFAVRCRLDHFAQSNSAILQEDSTSAQDAPEFAALALHCCALHRYAGLRKALVLLVVHGATNAGTSDSLSPDAIKMIFADPEVLGHVAPLLVQQLAALTTAQSNIITAQQVSLVRLASIAAKSAASRTGTADHVTTLFELSVKVIYRGLTTALSAGTPIHADLVALLSELCDRTLLAAIDARLTEAVIYCAAQVPLRYVTSALLGLLVSAAVARRDELGTDALGADGVSPMERTVYALAAAASAETSEKQLAIATVLTDSLRVAPDELLAATAQAVLADSSISGLPQQHMLKTVLAAYAAIASDPQGPETAGRLALRLAASLALSEPQAVSNAVFALRVIAHVATVKAELQQLAGTVFTGIASRNAAGVKEGLGALNPSEVAMLRQLAAKASAATPTAHTPAYAQPHQATTGAQELGAASPPPLSLNLSAFRS
jgi:hypothetical protein